MFHLPMLRLGKVESLFPISYFPGFDVGGWSLFIIDYAEMIQAAAIRTHFSWEKLEIIQKTMS